MSIYDNTNDHRKQKSVRLTDFQRQKLNHICGLFGITYQRFFCDAIDYFSMHTYDVQSGRVNISTALKESMLQLLDDYVKLKQSKGLIPTPYYRQKDLFKTIP